MKDYNRCLSSGNSGQRRAEDQERRELQKNRDTVQNEGGEETDSGHVRKDIAHRVVDQDDKRDSDTLKSSSDLTTNSLEFTDAHTKHVLICRGLKIAGS
jgi:hypothetical protein